MAESDEERPLLGVGGHTSYNSFSDGTRSSSFSSDILVLYDGAGERLVFPNSPLEQFCLTLMAGMIAGAIIGMIDVAILFRTKFFK